MARLIDDELLRKLLLDYLEPGNQSFRKTAWRRVMTHEELLRRVGFIERHPDWVSWSAEANVILNRLTREGRLVAEALAGESTWDEVDILLARMGGGHARDLLELLRPR